MIIETAVIVEPRLHQYLEPVINNMLQNLSNHTKIHIFHGTLNKNLLEIKYKNEISNNKIILTNLKIVNMTRVDYSNLLTNIIFWEQISGENILIFQTDSCLCCHVDNFDLSEYDKYGFIGAPSFNTYPIPWQNGGFSLRKRSLMILSILDKKKNENTWPEDKFYSVIKKHITNPAPYNLANKFSVERFYYNKPFGIHSAWKYLKKDQWELLKKDNPNIDLIFNNIIYNSNNIY